MEVKTFSDSLESVSPTAAEGQPAESRRAPPLRCWVVPDKEKQVWIVRCAHPAFGSPHSVTLFLSEREAQEYIERLRSITLAGLLLPPTDHQLS